MPVYSKALKRFNWLLTSNCSSRDEIDNLRNERERFESLSQKLEKEFRDLRSELVECIEQSVSSYEQRYVMKRSRLQKNRDAALFAFQERCQCQGYSSAR